MHMSTVESYYSDSSHRCLPSQFFHHLIDRFRQPGEGAGAVGLHHALRELLFLCCDRSPKPANPAQSASSSLSVNLQAGAGRELAAFYAAVLETYGPQEATVAAQDWIDEFEKSNDSAGSLPDWRQVTVVAAGYLASRITGESQSC